MYLQTYVTEASVLLFLKQCILFLYSDRILVHKLTGITDSFNFFFFFLSYPVVHPVANSPTAVS